MLLLADEDEEVYDDDTCDDALDATLRAGDDGAFACFIKGTSCRYTEKRQKMEVLFPNGQPLVSKEILHERSRVHSNR